MNNGPKAAPMRIINGKFFIPNGSKGKVAANSANVSDASERQFRRRAIMKACNTSAVMGVQNHHTGQTIEIVATATTQTTEMEPYAFRRSKNPSTIKDRAGFKAKTTANPGNSCSSPPA
jgi:hypothetical protein